LRVAIFVSTRQQNDQCNPNKKTDRDNQESKREASRTRRQGCQQQRRQEYKSSHAAEIRPVAHHCRILR